MPKADKYPEDAIAGKKKWLARQDEDHQKRFCPIHVRYWGHNGSLGCKECKNG